MKYFGVIISILLVLLFKTEHWAQTPSGISYPVAECVGGTCPPASQVRSHITASCLDTVNEVFYVGGRFRTLGGQSRVGIGAVEAETGVLLSFSPVIDSFGCIYSMCVKGDTLFIGGRFSSVNGVVRMNFAALNKNSGLLLNGYSSGIGNAADTVFSVVHHRNRLYVGGKFTSVFMQSRTNVARITPSGVVTSWSPSGLGIVRKMQVWNNQMVMITDAPSWSSRIVKVDTTTGSVVQLMLTTSGAAGYRQTFQDFVIRTDSLYVVGSFFEVDAAARFNFIVCHLGNAGKRPWSPAIPLNLVSGEPFHEKNRLSVELYRDSLYIGVADGSTQSTLYHRLYALHYRGNVLRTMKVYPSNSSGLQGSFHVDLVAGNARLFEIEKFAIHTNFPNGSIRCIIYSWCMKIPTVCATFTVNQTQACIRDTFWLAVRKESYYSSYLWSTAAAGVSLFPQHDSCLVITYPGFTGANVQVRGLTSCGIMNALPRATNISVLPSPAVNAGSDDSLTCVIQQIMLRGTCSPAPFSWSWTGGSSNADSLMVNQAGTYVLSCVGFNGCRANDTVQVIADTIPPVIVPNSFDTLLTCAVTTLTLDAAVLYPSDSLRWQTVSGPSADPLVVTQPAMYYLDVMSRRNGCYSRDSVHVSQNVTTPNAVAIYSDSLLTCSTDSILLTGYSSQQHVSFLWQDTSLQNYNEPFYATLPGAYALIATDTSNGCSSVSDVVFLQGWYTPPHVDIFSDTVFMNCSADSVLLDAASLTLSAELFWLGPTLFNVPDPAVADSIGLYQVTALDSLNGCISADSVWVIRSLWLEVDVSDDTTICPGDAIVISVAPSGGTPPFTYAWLNTMHDSSSVMVFPGDTTLYVVLVSDSQGCNGYDSVTVSVPDMMRDSALAFQPCSPTQPTGEIQLYIDGGVPPYQYSVDGGATWQTTSVFSGLNYGFYQFIIQDSLGCTRETTASIDTNSLSPVPEFLVSTSSELGDTLVFVDVSNPRPDSIAWGFPASVVVVDSNMFSPAVLFQDTGSVAVSMTAYYGDCEVEILKWVNVEEFDSLSAQWWKDNRIDSLVIYPNPNSGTFMLYTHLMSKQTFVIQVIDINSTEHYRMSVSNANEWSGTVSVPNVVPGNYMIRVIAEYDVRQLPFVITQ